MQRKHSNKENINPQLKKKENSSCKSHKMKSSTKSSKSPLAKGNPSKDTHQCTQRELSNLKSEVRRMRKEVELFKTYYLTQTQSYRSFEESQTRENVLAQLPPQMKKNSKERSTSEEEEYLINGNHSVCSKEQSQYYIQYYLEN